MAKIDTTRIEGYEGMTPEQRIAALEEYNFPDPDFSGYVKKETFDATASELAALKRQNRAQLSEEERKAQEAAAELERMKQELAEVKKRETVSEFKAKLLAQGYPEELASSTAAAMAEGDNEKVFANQQQFLTSYANQIKADLLKGTPTPPAGSAEVTKDYTNLIEKAQADGDMIAVAYYTRLQQQDNAANK